MDPTKKKEEVCKKRPRLSLDIPPEMKQDIMMWRARMKLRSLNCTIR